MTSDYSVLRAQLSALVEEPIDRLEPLTSGASDSAVYEAQLKQRSLVVKTNSRASVLDPARRNLQTLAALGIPVPRVVAYTTSLPGLDIAALVMTKIDGRDLRYVLDSMSFEAMTILAEQIVSFQRLAATLPANAGFGYAGIGETATRTWSDVARTPSGYAYANPLPKDVQEPFARVQTDLDKAEGYFTTVTPTCFLDDLTIKNVLVDDAGQLCGVVDLDVVAYGDPRLHIGLCAAAITAFLPSRCRFYVDELIRISELTPTQRAIVGLYQANYLVSFLGAESPEDRGPWRKAALTGVDSGLSEFEAQFELANLPSAGPTEGLGP